MKVTLIGATGFVGTRLIGLLQTSVDYELKNIDKQESLFFRNIQNSEMYAILKCLRTSSMEQM